MFPDIYYGDCLTIMKQIDNGVIDAIITDPPYGMTDLDFDKKELNWKLFWKEVKRICKPDANIILFSQQPFTTDLIISNKKNFRYEIIYEKSCATGHLNVGHRPLKNHENILVFNNKIKKTTYNPQKKEGKPYYSKPSRDNRHYSSLAIPTNNKDGLRHPLTVVKFCNHISKKATTHPSEKPLKLLEYLIKTYSNENDTVLDCFAGSGTTGVACIKHNRRYILIEKDKNYFEECQNRIISEWFKYNLCV